MAINPTTTVPVVNATASVEEIVAALKVAGGVIIRNAVGQEALDQIEYTSPYLCAGLAVHQRPVYF